MKKKTNNIKPRPKPGGDAKGPEQDSEDEGIISWLKTSSGMEYMTMFVILNSVIVFLTMSWPQMKQAWGTIESFFEMIGLGLLRGVFLGGIMMWYSMSVWKTVDQYFRDQFQEYLTKEYQENSAIKRDVLMEKERLAAKKVLLEKLEKLDSNVNEEVEPEYDDRMEAKGGIIYGGEPGTTGIFTERWLSHAEHGGYSVEEVDPGPETGETGESLEMLEDDEVTGGGSVFEEEDGGTAGECLVEDCDGHGEKVSTRWRNVFEEDADEVCRFDEDLGPEGSCSQELGDFGDERMGENGGGNK